MLTARQCKSAGSIVEADDIFDPSEAMSRACDDVELMAELAELFNVHRDQLLAELTQAVAVGDAELIVEHSHAIKGSIGTFTTKRPYELARQLELAGREQNIAAWGPILAELKQSLAMLEQKVSWFLGLAR